MKGKKITFLGVSSGICAPTAKGQIGAELGFDAIRAFALSSKTEDDGTFDARRIFIDNTTKTVISTEDLYEYIWEMDDDKIFFDDLQEPPSNYKENKRLARHIGYLRDIFDEIRADVYETLRDNKFPFVIAGDHSTATATIEGIKRYLERYEPDKKLGIIWIDAHMDAHNPYTTPTGNMHGMSVGLALNLKDDYGVDLDENARRKGLLNKYTWIPDDWNDIALSDKHKISFSDLVYVAIRDYEPYERKLLSKGIKHYKYSNGIDENENLLEPGYFDKLKDEKNVDKELPQVCEEIKLYFKERNYDYLYISFDIDSISGENLKKGSSHKNTTDFLLNTHLDEPIYGTGTPVKKGLTKEDAKFILNYFWKQDDVPIIAFEIVEVSPLLDLQNRTAEVAFDIIKSLIKNHQKAIK